MKFLCFICSALSDIAAQRQAQESYLKQETVTAAGDCCAEDKPTDVSSGLSTSSATASSTVPDKTTASASGSGGASASGSGGVEKQASSGSQKPEKRAVCLVRCLEEQWEDSTNAVVEKLEWATGLLRQTQDLDTSIRLCNLIKCCADTINSLRSADGCKM